MSKQIRLTKQIKDRIMAELQCTSRQVSVKEHPGGLSTRITITPKSIDIDVEKLKKIAKEFEDFERCPASGEILCGGNTFIFVNQSTPVYE